VEAYEPAIAETPGRNGFAEPLRKSWDRLEATLRGTPRQKPDSLLTLGVEASEHAERGDPNHGQDDDGGCQEAPEKESYGATLSPSCTDTSTRVGGGDEEPGTVTAITRQQ